MTYEPILTQEDVTKIKNSAITIIDKITELYNLDDENFQIQSNKLDKISKILHKSVQVIDKISKIEYAVDKKDETESDKLSHKQVIARELVREGMIIIPPKNRNKRQDLIYRCVQTINEYRKADTEELERATSAEIYANEKLEQMYKEKEELYGKDYDRSKDTHGVWGFSTSGKS